jgi:flavin reductase (DIM6/NTAB) family NADH-FMN oxidoreductase RutF
MGQDKAGISPESVRGVLELLPPFPIVLVTTRTNVITIGQISYFTFTPLRIGIAVAHSRHTFGLLRDEREFVVNVPDSSLVDAVKRCGAVSGRDGDKFQKVGLTPVASEAVSAVSIDECGASIECVVEKELEYEKRTWFVGTVAAARRRSDHRGADALLCGRTEYSVPGEPISPR